MRILFVSTNVPVPANSGQSIRSLSILRALASSNHELSFVSFSDGDRSKDLSSLSSLCRSVKLFERKSTSLTLQRDYLPRLKSMLQAKCYSVERFRSEAFRDSIRQQIAESTCDAIICDGIYALGNIPETGVPILLNCHNVEFVILQRYAQLQSNVLKKRYAELESALMRSEEKKACRKIAGSMVCSQIDLEILQKLCPSLPISVIPNVVDTDFIQPGKDTSAPGSGPIVLFQGVMDWYPNRDAAESFVRKILPLVREKYPNIKFVIAGRNPPVDFVAQFSSDSGIEFTGTVADMRPYLAAAIVVVVPLRIGGGTRIKILEACAAGKPVVSTTVGAEGLNLQSGRELLLADDPEQFASCVLNLLRDPALRDAFAEAGRRAVVERYSQDALKTSLDSFLARFNLPSAVREENTDHGVVPKNKSTGPMQSFDRAGES